MNFIEELEYDLDFREPKIVIKDNLCQIDNAKSIVMIGSESMTVEAGKKFVTVLGSDFIIREILERRLLIEGQIKGIELHYPSGKG
ncbi:MAG: YabP/YqfC family sporulation protein [Firmicutes bacterium]|nr:YabP/YqfC family sporulation protein [Bacillota bacterium]